MNSEYRKLPPSETKYHMMIMKNDNKTLIKEIIRDNSILYIENGNNETVFEMLLRLRKIETILLALKHKELKWMAYIRTESMDTIYNYFHSFTIGNILLLINNYNSMLSKAYLKQTVFHPQNNLTDTSLNPLNKLLFMDNFTHFKSVVDKYIIYPDLEQRNLFTLAIESIDAIDNEAHATEIVVYEKKMLKWIEYLVEKKIEYVDRIPGLSGECPPLYSPTLYKYGNVVERFLEIGANPNLSLHITYPLFHLIEYEYYDLLIKYQHLFDFNKVSDNMSNALIYYFDNIIDNSIENDDDNGDNDDNEDNDDVTTIEMDFDMINLFIIHMKSATLCSPNVDSQSIFNIFDFHTHMINFHAFTHHLNYLKAVYPHHKLTKSIIKTFGSSIPSTPSIPSDDTNPPRVPLRFNDITTIELKPKMMTKHMIHIDTIKSRKLKKYSSKNNIKLFGIHDSIVLKPFDNRIHTTPCGLIIIKHLFDKLLKLPELKSNDDDDILDFNIDSIIDEQIKQYLLVDRLILSRFIRIIYYDSNHIFFPINRDSTELTKEPYICYYLSIIAKTTVGQLKLHANIIIIDNVHKIIEHYDPYGRYYPDTDVWLRNKFSKLTMFKEYTFRMPITDHSFALQHIQISNFSDRIYQPEGYCIAWCMWYLCQRLTNPRVYPCQLQKHLLNYLISNNIDMNQLMEKFGSWIEMEKETLLGIEPAEFNKKELGEADYLKLGQLLREKWK